MSGQGRQGSEGGQTDDAPIVEWVLAAVAVVVVLGMVAYLVYIGVSAGSGPPDLHPRVVRTVEQGGSHTVLVEVENLGGSPAAAVVVQGRLFAEGDDVQTSEVTIDYIPVDSTGDGGIVFTEPPQEYDLQLRVQGYRTP